MHLVKHAGKENPRGKSAYRDPIARDGVEPPKNDGHGILDARHVAKTEVVACFGLGISSVNNQK